jgi:hypothetical protein
VKTVESGSIPASTFPNQKPNDSRQQATGASQKNKN